MFTEITNPTNPLRTENFLRPYKRGEKEFTPEVAREVLTMTNHKKNICDTLQLIASQQNQADYKDIILSAFDHREQPNDTLLLGKKLAAANGFEDELNNILNYDYINDTNDGIVYASAANQIAAVITADEGPDVCNYPENCTLYCISSYVDLFRTNLSHIKSLKFKEGAEVDLHYCQNLPADLDVSMCKEVDLSNTNLSPVKSLKFKEGANVYLNDCENLPADLDVSLCCYLKLNNNDLSPVKNLKFKENSRIRLSFCQNLPPDLDVSMCADVDLSNNNLSPVKSLKFQKNSIVDLSNCTNCPEKLDVSGCKSVNFWNCDLSDAKVLIFKNKQQQEAFEAPIHRNWQGTIQYADTPPMINKLKSLFSR